ncbi:MAG: sugar phosphate isomerase/epimerase [Deltaproteobacteria bacterium]|nr:sugar phosphate isomerase/epimerase [Deltaproteobacteria bacterium]
MKDKDNSKDLSPKPKKVYAWLLDQVQVNAPYRQLVDRYLELFIKYSINPEIGFDAFALDTKSEATMAEVARLLAENGRTVTFHGPFMDLAPGGLDETIRKATLQRLQRTMDLVPLFAPGSVVFHAGYDASRYHGHREEWLSKSLATWELLTEMAEEMGVAIYLENVYEQTPEMILTLIERLSSEYLGFCLDVGHMNVFGEAPLAEWLDALGPHLREVHLHDNDGRSDSHAAIGSGTVPFEELFQYLRHLEMKPLITLEPHEEATLWASLESLGALWPWEE